MPEPIASAFVRVSADTKAATTALGGVSKSLLKIGAAIGGIYALKKAFTACYDAVAEFDRELRYVWTVADATWEEMEKLGDQVADLARAYPQTGAEAVRAMYQIYSSGFQGAEAMNVLEAALKGASAGLTEVATAGDVVLAILNAWQRPASEAMQIQDKLFQTVRFGIITYKELASTFGRLAGVAAPLGIELEDLLAAIIVLTRQGLKADEAITALRAAIMQLLSPSEALKAIIEALGFASGEAIVREWGFAKALNEVTRVGKAAGIPMTELFNNVRAVTAVLPLATSQTEEYTRFQEALAEATGATAEAHERLAEGIEYQAKVLRSAWHDLMREFSESMKPTISWLQRTTLRVVEWLDDILKRTNKLREIRETHPEYWPMLLPSLEELEETERALEGTTDWWASFQDQVSETVTELQLQAALLERTLSGVADTTEEKTEEIGLSFRDLSFGISSSIADIRSALSAPGFPELGITFPGPTLFRPPEVTFLTPSDVELWLGPGLEQAEEGLSEVAQSAAVLAMRWKRGAQELLDTIEETPLEALPAIKKFLEEFREIDPALLAGAEALRKLEQQLLDLIEARELMDLPTEDLRAALEEIRLMWGEAEETWEDILREIRALAGKDPVQAAENLASFMGSFQDIPGAMIAGASTAKIFASQLEQLAALAEEGIIPIPPEALEAAREALAPFIIELEEATGALATWQDWIRKTDLGPLINAIVSALPEGLGAQAQEFLLALEPREVEVAIGSLAGALGAGGRDVLSILSALAAGNWVAAIPAAVSLFTKALQDPQAMLDELKRSLEDFIDRTSAAFFSLIERIGDATRNLADLILASKEYSRVQRALTSVSDALMGILLRPLSFIADLLEAIAKYLGFTAQAAEEAYEALNVPAGFKAARLEYAAARPGEPYIPPAREAGEELPGILGDLIPVLDRLKESLEPLVGLFASLEEPIRKALAVALEALIGGLEGLVEKIIALGPILTETLPSIIQNAFLIVGELFVAGVSGLVSALEPLLPSLEGFLDHLEGVTAALEPVMDAFGRLAGEVLATLLDLGGSLADWVGDTLLPRLREWLERIGGWWTSIIEPLLKSEVLPFFIDMLSQVVEFIDSKLMPILEGKLLPFIRDVLWPKLEEIGGRLLAIFEDVLNFIEEHWPQIEALIMSKLDAWIRDIEGYFDKIKAYTLFEAGDLWGALRVIWDSESISLWDKLKISFGMGFTHLINWILDELGPSLSKLGNAFRDFLWALEPVVSFFLLTLKPALWLLQMTLEGLTWALEGLALALGWILEFVKFILNGIIGMINAVISAINLIPGVNIPHIPYLEEGGVIEKPILALLGEAGPEAVIPLNRMPAFAPGGMLRIEVPLTISGREVARAVKEAEISDLILRGQW
ncbi:MAG: phage tail tape measure protein [Candidatus Methanosuratincola petrocarbonis]